MRPHGIPAVVLAVAVLSAYSWVVFRFEGLGPEFPLFWMWNCRLDVSGLLEKYLQFDTLWYRPSAFYLPYCVARYFVGWHNLAGWRFIHAASVIPVCWGVYALACRFFPGDRLAGVLAALYVAVYPGMYSIVLETSAFDNVHIVFVLAAALLFDSAWQASAPAGRFATAGVAFVCCVAALTAKESTLVLPLYLAILTLRQSRGRWWLWLVPYAALLAAYAALHIRLMPGFGDEGDYRTGFNAEVIGHNLQKYPLWILRFFAWPADPHALGHDHARNTAIAAVLAVALSAYWIPRLRREPAARRPVFFLGAWIAVFLALPVFSGRYLWHVNLALCGYAVLLGVALSAHLRALGNPAVRYAATALLGIGFVAAGIASSRDAALRGLHAADYVLNARLFASPLIPPPPSSGPALVYVEDRRRLGNWWHYGARRLVPFMMLNPDIEQQVVPPRPEIPPDLRERWFNHPNAYFYTYDNQDRWVDATAAFRGEIAARRRP